MMFSNMRWLRCKDEDDCSVRRTSTSLIIKPPGKRDYWMKTYYLPEIKKADGPAFVSRIRPNERNTTTVDLEFKRRPGAQFDQGGLIVFINKDCWLKTGIEYVDDVPRMSAVVTNFGWSDWSTKKVASSNVRIRLSQCGNGSYVIESQSTSSDRDDLKAWDLVRICHLSAALTADTVDVGIFACCPVANRECDVIFKNYRRTKGVLFKHDANDTEKKDEAPTSSG